MTLTHPEPSTTTSTAPEEYARCESCGAPLDEGQRYCVNCGTRRREAPDPASEYFASAAERSRRGTTASTAAPPRNGPSIAVAILVCLIPVAVAIGVVVGQSGGDDTDKVLSALRHQKPQVVNLGGTGTAANASTTTSSAGLKSDWTLSKGFTVKLSTLPVSGTDQAAATKAKADATAKGATAVGLINPKQFTTTPSQGATNYVIYSGQFKTRAQAEAALKKLKPKFSGATVLAVSSASASTAGSHSKVVAKTKYGTAHQVTGFKASKQQVASDKQLVQKIQKEQGRNYVDSQKNIPDQVVVTGGNPNDAPDSGPGQP
jgi:putative intracellular protease/amidase